MRRVVGLTLTGLGAFFVALAVLMRFYLPGQVIKFPLNEYTLGTATGQNMSYFSQKELKVLTGVNMQATSTVEGDVAAGTSSVAVWQEFTALEDTTNREPVEYTSQRSAFNRRTGVLVNCCGERIGSNTKVRQSGQGYVWPFGAQKKTYQVFDTTLLRPVPFRYEGSKTIDGLTTYKYVEQVNNQRFGSQTLPGSLVGIKNQASVTLPEYLTATNSFWVDPVTGAPVAVTENDTVSLEDSTGATKLVLLKGTVTTTPKSVQSFVNTAKSGGLKINFVQGYGPLIGLLVGLVLIGFGMVLLLRTPQDAEPSYADDELEGSTA